MKLHRLSLNIFFSQDAFLCSSVTTLGISLSRSPNRVILKSLLASSHRRPTSICSRGILWSSFVRWLPMHQLFLFNFRAVSQSQYLSFRFLWFKANPRPPPTNSWGCVLNFPSDSSKSPVVCLEVWDLHCNSLINLFL